MLEETVAETTPAAFGRDVPDGEDTRADECAALGALYRLLGRTFEREADAAFIDLLRGPLKAPLAEAGAAFDDTLWSPARDRLLGDLAEEYTGLLVAPGAMLPYASVAETGAMFQSACDHVAAAYRESGFEYRGEFSGEFPDHIGTMLAFLGTLCDAEADALRTGTREAAETARRRRERFLDEQLAHWAPGWCQRVARAANHVLYRDMAALTERILWADLAQVVSVKRLRELEERNRREPPRLDYDADFRKASGL